jgi:hypothetical protein
MQLENRARQMLNEQSDELASNLDFPQLISAVINNLVLGAVCVIGIHQRTDGAASLCGSLGWGSQPTGF